MDTSADIPERIIATIQDCTCPSITIQSTIETYRADYHMTAKIEVTQLAVMAANLARGYGSVMSVIRQEANKVGMDPEEFDIMVLKAEKQDSSSAC